jgi:hypothetical protein
VQAPAVLSRAVAGAGTGRGVRLTNRAGRCFSARSKRAARGPEAFDRRRGTRRRPPPSESVRFARRPGPAAPARRGRDTRSRTTGRRPMKKILLAMSVSLTILVATSCQTAMDKPAAPPASSIGAPVMEKVIAELGQAHGEAAKARIEAGVHQAAALWRREDGSDADFEEFCRTHFVGSEAGLDSLFRKLEINLEVLIGSFNKIGLDLKRPLDLDMGPIQPIDEMFGAYSAGAHMNEDLFGNKIAFVVLLNFPHYGLREKNEQGLAWSRRQWAYARMGDVFVSREPATLLQAFAAAQTGADTYISTYNIYMGRLVDPSGKTFFPADLKLITHWGLRDELKSRYADPQGGLEKQKLIYQVMKRIVDQSIPRDVINNPALSWDPVENKVYKGGAAVTSEPEPDTRYRHLLDNFAAAHALDPYNPSYPTFMARSFDQGMELTQADVESLFVGLCSSAEVQKVAALIGRRLGRPLQPFDIWYDGFKPRGSINEQDLDRIVGKKYPTPQAFQADIPIILEKLGFPAEKARAIASRIVVDPSRGAGHAAGAFMKSDVARLRTRVGAHGMDYKGYNIAVHEFGHTVEQTITLQDVDDYMMSGVPTNAFTEALAFTFQKRDLELLGRKDTDPDKAHWMALDSFWSSYEIMGVALVDAKVWKWMYDHPAATPAELKAAVIAAAKEVWNRYYAGVFGSKDEPILAIYSHMVEYPLYLPAYPVGHLIDFQVERQLAGKSFADEVERMYRVGRLAPQVWMHNAVGGPLSIQPLLQATDEALAAVGGAR